MSSAWMTVEEIKGYGREHKLLGRPIASHQAIQHRVADMITRLTATQAFVYHCCNLFVKGRRCEREVAIAKLYASDTYREVVDTCVDIEAVHAHPAEGIVDRMYRDALFIRTFSGSPEMMKEVISQEIGR